MIQTREKVVFSWNLKCYRPTCRILKGFDRPIISKGVISFPIIYSLSHGCRPFFLAWVACLVCSLEMRQIIGVYTACGLRHQYLNQLWPKILQLSSRGVSCRKGQGLAAPILLGACVHRAAGVQVCLSKAWLRQSCSTASKAAVRVQISLTYF